MIVLKLFCRSADAEGNPLHKSFTRNVLPGPVDVSEAGIAISSDWHRDKQVTERQGAGAHPNDRALLLQTRRNLEQLSELFPSAGTLNEDASFGENVLLDGGDVAQLCAGDELGVMRGDKCVCVLQITSPRWPCYKVDKRHSGQMTARPREEQVRGACCGTGLAGFFARVLMPGSLCVGDAVAVRKRPQPEWPLSRVSHVFYGGPNRRTAMLDCWNGTERELRYCLESLPELAEFEWRDRLVKFVAKRRAVAETAAAAQRWRWRVLFGVLAMLVLLAAIALQWR